jgi:hypothetical protein
MAVTTTSTTTTNVASQPLRTVLADYELHKSEPPAASPVRSSPQGTQNPSDWPQDHRRIPPHRPVNRNLDRSQIMVYRNAGEHAFIQTMFFGIRVVTVRLPFSNAMLAP